MSTISCKTGSDWAYKPHDDDDDDEAANGRQSYITSSVVCFLAAVVSDAVGEVGMNDR